MLKLAKDLSVPTDIVTQTPGFFGRKGSGKTYAAGKLAEEMLDAGTQVVILDPVGNWYGLRLDSSGKHASRFTLPILGGEHGDVPLQPQAGAIVADFVVNTGSSAIIDVSRFRKGERKEFVTAFAEELFHKKKSNRSPMHFIIEEAQVFAPQKTFKGEERMLGALEDIVRLGRNYGIGSSMISQRPQSVNTEVRNQCEPLIVFQLVAKHERDAIGDWMEHMGVEHDLEALAKLQPGECFFWSPAWLDRFVKTKFLEKETFDASATPKVGVAPKEPKKLAPVDLGALQVAMKDTIEKAKADDPKELKRKIGELEKQLQRTPAVYESQVVKQLRVDLAESGRIIKGQEATINALKVATDRLTAQIQAGIDATAKAVREFNDKIQKLREAKFEPILKTDYVKSVVEPAERVLGISNKSNGSSNSKLPIGEHKILAAALQHISVTREQLTVLTGYKRSSRDAYIQRLREKGYLEIVDDRLQATEPGAFALPQVEPLPTGAELRDYWIRRLPEGEKRVLEIALDSYPDAVERAAIDSLTGYKRSSRDAYIYRLSARELIKVTGPGEFKASEILFQ